MKIRKSRYFSIHTHSEFSARDALGTVSSIVERARELGYRGLALTDHGNIAGSVELYKECRSNGIKPFPGMEIYLSLDRHDKVLKEKRYHVGVISYTTEGYRNLVNLTTLSHMNFHRYPIVDLQDLAELSAAGKLRGIALTTGCYFGYVIQSMLEDGPARARQIIKTFTEWFDVVYVEIQRHRIENQGEEWIAENLEKIADQLGLDILLGQDSHYVHPEDQEVHNALKQMISWADNPAESVFPGDGYHMVGDDWMLDHHGEALYERAMYGHDDLLSRWDMNIEEFERYEYRIPTVVSDPTATLKNMVAEGLAGRGCKGAEYEARIQQEFETVELAGMADYFILVHDVCEHMREQGIEYQTRGSAAGSLIAYALKITNVDPLVWGTSFDRFMGRPNKRFHYGFEAGPLQRTPHGFSDLIGLTELIETLDYGNREWIETELTLLATNDAALEELIGIDRSGVIAMRNPNNSSIAHALGITDDAPTKEPDFTVVTDRKSPPDIDLDVDNKRRLEVLEWLNDRYSVTQIGNWMEMGFSTDPTGNQVKDDAGSVMVRYRATQRKKLASQGYSKEQITELLKWENISIEDRKLIQRVSDFKPYSNAGTHACGLILTSSQSVMDNMVPKMWIASAKTAVSQFDMSVVESIGLVKLDLLGSKTVAVMSRVAKELGYADIEELKASKEFSYNDPGVYAAMRMGKTEGVFQLEGYTSTKGVKELKPRNIRDIIAAMALFRPASQDAGATDSFMARRQKREAIPQLAKVIQDVIGPTQGIVLYQDQIIDILRGVGMNPDDLTQFLKAVKASNKNQGKAGKVIERYLPMIHKLCQQHGVGEEDWEWLKETFIAATGYGFNKCCSGSTRILVDTPVDGKTMMHKAGANAGTSKEMTLEEFYNVFHGPNTPARKKYRNKKLGLRIAGRVDGRLKMVRIKDVFKQGVKQVWRVTLEDGKQITATADHRHLTSEGWKEVRNLNVGDELATMGEYEKYASNRNPKDYNTGSRVPRWTKGRSIVYSKVVSIEDAGEEMTYDLEIDSEDHSWVGNGIVTHNSHATVYGITAYITQWMQVNHPDVFFANLISVHIDNPEKVEIYEAAARARGVKILRADVAESSALDYRVVREGVIRRPLRTIAGVGAIAANCIEEIQPIKDFDDFLGRVNGAKVTGVKDFKPGITLEIDLKGTLKSLHNSHALESIGGAPLGR